MLYQLSYLSECLVFKALFSLPGSLAGRTAHAPDITRTAKAEVAS